MNQCMFMGNITHDPELRTVGTQGTQVLNFSIAVSRNYKRSNGETVKEVNFFPLEAWDSGAETIHRHFKKGDPIIVFCSAKNEKWEDKEGNKRSTIKFRVDRFEFVPSRTRKENDETRQTTDDSDDNTTGSDPIPF